MPSGGKRQGAGRKSGPPLVKTSYTLREGVADQITHLAETLECSRGEAIERSIAMLRAETLKASAIDKTLAETKDLDWAGYYPVVDCEGLITGIIPADSIDSHAGYVKIVNGHLEEVDPNVGDFDAVTFANDTEKWTYCSDCAIHHKDSEGCPNG